MSIYINLEDDWNYARTFSYNGYIITNRSLGYHDAIICRMIGLDIRVFQRYLVKECSGLVINMSGFNRTVFPTETGAKKAVEWLNSMKITNKLNIASL